MRVVYRQSDVYFVDILALLRGGNEGILAGLRS
jgi:hypothetical protein